MRIAIGLFVFLSVVIVALLMTLAVLRRQPTAAVLPSGVRVEYLGVAVGKSDFTTEKSWHRATRHWLPAPLAKFISPTYYGSCYSGSNGVTYYFKVVDPASLGGTPWSSYSAEDESGFRFERGGGYCSSGSGANKIYGLILPGFPRRQSSFRFNFLDSAGQPVAMLQVPNPVKGPFPRWQPQALPQTRTGNSVTLQLESLRMSRNMQWPAVIPHWKLTASDPAWAGAKVRNTAFLDATGNEGQFLSSREPAWRARAQVFRERPEDFSNTERFVITNLSIPAAASFINVDQSAERLGVKLSVIALVGPGRFYLTNGVDRGVSSDTSTGSSTSTSGTNRTESWGGPQHFLLLEARNVQPNDEILMRFVDEGGREIKLGDSSGYSGGENGARTYKRNFTPPASVTSLNLEVIVNRPLVFEFMVNPADVQPADSPKQ